MSVADNRRKPQSFAADDPALIAAVDVEGAPSPGTRIGPDGAETPAVVGPTLRPWGGPRWGMVLISALAGAALLGAAATFARLVSAALTREDWVGWTTLILLAIAAFAALVLALGEVIGFLGLARLNRLRSEAERAVGEGDRQRELRAALRLARLYAGRAELAWSVRRFRDHARDVHDPGELLALAERDMLTPLDLAGRRLITGAAKRVATVTALSPLMMLAVAYVAFENLRLLRALAGVYGGRPGVAGVLRLANMVFAHLLATGGIALTDDLLGQFLGQDVLRRLSRRLGEGAFNGALTARIGIAALNVIRPLPFRATAPPRPRDILGEVLKPMVGRDAP
jgi:putative membrane protein